MRLLTFRCYVEAQAIHAIETAVDQVDSYVAATQAHLQGMQDVTQQQQK